MTVIIYSLVMLLFFGLGILIMDVIRSLTMDGKSTLVEVLISLTPRDKKKIEKDFDNFMNQKD